MRHNSSLVCMIGITYVYIDTVFAFYGYILLFFLTRIHGVFVVVFNET